MKSFPFPKKNSKVMRLLEIIKPASFAEIKSHGLFGNFTTWTANLELQLLPPLHLLLVVDHLPGIGHHILLLLLLQLNSVLLGQVLDDCDKVLHQTCVLVIGDVACYNFFSSCAKSCSFYMFLIFTNWDECGFGSPEKVKSNSLAFDFKLLFSAILGNGMVLPFVDPVLF